VRKNQSANAAPSAEEIKSLEHERNVAMVNGDATELDRMTAHLQPREYIFRQKTSLGITRNPGARYSPATGELQSLQ
jgi:hypothetical protein